MNFATTVGKEIDKLLATYRIYLNSRQLHFFFGKRHIRVLKISVNKMAAILTDIGSFTRKTKDNGSDWAVFIEDN